MRKEKLLVGLIDAKDIWYKVLDGEDVGIDATPEEAKTNLNCLDDLIECVNKQIPQFTTEATEKRHIKVGFSEYDITNHRYACQKCGKSIDKQMAMTLSVQEESYCPFCGQMLDWSKTDLKG